MGIKSNTERYPDSPDPDSFESGLEYQDFVQDILLEQGIVVSCYSSRRYQYEQGESRQGIEIKLDRRILETGNVSIEVGEKRRASQLAYRPSGILREDNTWLYVQGNYQIIFLFPLNILRLLFRMKRYKVDELPTVRRFLMPIESARKYAAKVIELPFDLEVQHGGE